MDFYIQWDITNKCNLNCEHCYKNSEIKEKELDLKEYIKICDIINKTAEENELNISLSITGGEPFARKEDLFTILKYIERKRGIKTVQILTNGLLIEDNDIEELKRISKLQGIQISLESPKKEIHEFIRGKDTYEKTLNIIQKLVDNNIMTYVMMTISKLNYMELEEMYNLLKKIGVQRFGIDRFIPESKEDFNKFALNKRKFKEVCEIARDLSTNEGYPKVRTNRALYCLLGESIGGACSVGKTALAILPNGDILPCRRLPIVVGNILIDGIVKVWNESDVLNKCRENSNLKGKCNNCQYIKRCRGCRAMAYAVSGDYLEEDPLCWKE